MNILGYYKPPATWIYSSLPFCPDWVQTLPAVAVAIQSGKTKIIIYYQKDESLNSN